MNNQPRKTTKKLRRTLFVFLLCVVLLPFVLALALMIPSVQSFVVKKLVHYAGKEIGAEVDLQAFYYKPWKTVSLEGLLVRDQDRDTLLWVEALEVGIGNIDLESNFIGLDEVHLTRPYAQLYIAEGDTVTNLQFILDALRSDTSSEAKPFSLGCNTLLIDSGRFYFDDYNVARKEDSTVDFKHLRLSWLSGEINGFAFADSVQAEVTGLTFQEQCGLELRNLDTRASFSDHLLVADALYLVTNRSVLEGAYSMRYEGLEAFQHFFEEVELTAELTTGQVDFADVGFFSEAARDILTPLEFKGRVQGTLANLKGDVDSLRFASEGFMAGKVRLRGLPSVKDLNIDADVALLRMRSNDFEALLIPMGDSKARIDLPVMVDRLGQIEFRGRFTGFVNDFVTYGDLRTALGALKADVNIKTTGEEIQYGGAMSTRSFDIGNFLANEQFGIAAFDIRAEGESFELKKMNIKAKGKVDRIDILDYSYQNITLDGSVNREVFEGNVSMKDPNGTIDFTGTVNMRGKMPQIKCVSRVSELRLAPLKLVPSDTFGMVSAMITLDMKGSSQSTLHGELKLNDFEYANQHESIRLDSLYLTDRLTGEGHDILIQSDYAQVQFAGNTNLFDMPYAFMQVGNVYAPGLFQGVDLPAIDSTQVVTFDLLLHKNRELAEFVHPDLHIDRPLHLYGTLRSKDSLLQVHMDSLYWRFGTSVFKGHTAQLSKGQHGLELDMYMRELAMSDDYFLESFTTHSTLLNDSLWNRVSWANHTKRSDSGTLELLAYKGEQYAYNLVLQHLYARIADATWVSQQPARLSADSNYVKVQGLDISSSLGRITCNGTLDTKRDAHLLLDVTEFDLSYISRFGLIENDLEGRFTGEVDLYRLGENLMAEADMQLDSLVVDSFEIGSLNGRSQFDSEREALDLNIELNYKELRNVRIVGEYFPRQEFDQLDLDVAFNEFRASVIEPFVSKYAQGLEGEVDGTVHVSGPISGPILDGALRLRGFAAHVEYLNTSYRVPDATLHISDDMITADYIEVIDEKGSKGHLNGTVIHDQFKDLNYEIFMTVDDFLVLNTTLADNPDYYGMANMTGDVNISGKVGQTEIVVEAETNKDTRLSIPLENTGGAGEIDYIRFVQPKEKKDKRREGDVVLDEEYNNLNLDFQLSVTDDAEVQIIFDEKIGDVIKVRGNGDMLMRIDNRGTFNMYGDYTMTGGDYLFTLQNVINKRFTVQNGSKITWTGSPTEASVDLTAIYDLRASPINLTASVGDTSAVYRKRMPVDVFLKMQGKLLEPRISFDVDLPSLPESDIANQLLDPRTTSEQDMNQQVFALLLTNNFFTQGSGVSALGVAGQTTTYEMVSNQFSNWVSQYFDNIDVGVNYRPGDDNAAQQTEVNVSTELFNDRVMVEVNGSVQGDNGATEQTNNVAGEFNVEYKINPALSARVFNEANNYNPTNINQSPYTQGAGLFYRREFDSFLKDFFKSDKKKKLNR